jgi:DNA uptake protein ComE-like DNA-binding protein
MVLSAWGQKFNPRRQALVQRIAQEPYYRFSSLEEIAIATELGIRIEVSQATIDDWLRLPGISIHQARQWVELAQMGVQFLCIDDLAAALSLPVQRLQPFASLLTFSYLDPDSLLAPQRLNPNRATPAALAQIPGISPDLVHRLLAERQSKGIYQNLVDFQRRLDIDGESLTKIMHYLQF